LGNQEHAGGAPVLLAGAADFSPDLSAAVPSDCDFDSDAESDFDFDSDFESDVDSVPDFNSPSGFLAVALPLLLKSVAYQPLPFNWKPAADTSLTSAPVLHDGHATSGASDSFCSASSS
jgi:hypothetical protein